MHAFEYTQTIIDTVESLFRETETKSHEEAHQKNGKGGNLAAVMEVISKAVAFCDVNEINAGLSVCLSFFLTVCLSNFKSARNAHYVHVAS
jgi:hypothetical protein